jgi:hypothetical protein
MADDIVSSPFAPLFARYFIISAVSRSSAAVAGGKPKNSR